MWLIWHCHTTFFTLHINPLLDDLCSQKKVRIVTLMTTMLGLLWAIVIYQVNRICLSNKPGVFYWNLKGSKLIRRIYSFWIVASRFFCIPSSPKKASHQNGKSERLSKYRWWKNPANQWRLVVYPHYLQGSFNPRWWSPDFFHQQYVEMILCHEQRPNCPNFACEKYT